MIFFISFDLKKNSFQFSYALGNLEIMVTDIVLVQNLTKSSLISTKLGKKNSRKTKRSIFRAYVSQQSLLFDRFFC